MGGYVHRYQFAARKREQYTHNKRTLHEPQENTSYPIHSTKKYNLEKRGKQVSQEKKEQAER